MTRLDRRFVLADKLGEGAFGEAYSATDETTGDSVVVKLLRAAVTDPSTVERFRREIRALEELDHPSVVSLIAHGICPESARPYYVMAHAEGAELGDIIEEIGRLTPTATLRVAKAVLAALEHAHARGIVHRDLKPQNLIVSGLDTDQPQVLLIDFGLAKHADGGQRTIADLTQGTVLGTPRYMSPEQCAGQVTEPASDIYALGCVLMELFTGEPPFVLTPGSSVISLLCRHVIEEPPRLEERWPEAPKALADLVAACLEKEPEGRPTATAALAALAALDGEATAPVATQDSETTPAVAEPIGLPRLEEGASFDGLPLLRHLGAGGFGTVFLTQVPDGRQGALKILTDPDADGGLMQARLRFAREVRLLRALEHRAIPAVLADGECSGYPYVVLELIDGEDLDVLLLARGRFELNDALTVLRQIVPALDHAHCYGVVHCDLKPANVRIRADGKAFLLDLGIAKLRAGSALGGRSIETVEGGVIGTLHYLPPEFATGRKTVTPMADVYSLGVMVYELLSGRTPFHHDDPRALLRLLRSSSPRHLSEFATSLPPEATTVVMRCLEKDPGARFPSAGEFLRALEVAARPALPPTAAAPALPPTAPAPVLPPTEAAPVLPPTAPAPVLPPTAPITPTVPIPVAPAVAPTVAVTDPTAPAPSRPTGVPGLAVAVLTGSRAGDLLPLPEAGTFTIGRNPASGLALDPYELDLSTHHAEIDVGNPATLTDTSSTGTWVEGRRLEAGERIPLARGVQFRLGKSLVIVFDSHESLKPLESIAWDCQRADALGATIEISSPVSLGRSPSAGAQVVPESETSVSAVHCRLTPVFGRLILEDLQSTNGTFVDDERVSQSLLEDGEVFRLGGEDGPRFRVRRRDVGATPRPKLVLGDSTVALETLGDALRAKLEVTVGEETGCVFLFGGSQLRFGRNRTAGGGPRENDIVLRGLKRVDEAPSLVTERTQRVSRRHGVVMVTRDGLAIRDEGSKYGTELDGEPLPPKEIIALSETFLLQIPQSVGLRGTVLLRSTARRFPPSFGVPEDHPVGALRLERTRDGEQHTYLLVLDEITLGTGDADGIPLRAGLGVMARHAALGVREGQFVLTALKAGVVLGDSPLRIGVSQALRPGTAIKLGGLVLLFSSADGNDMKG